MSNYNINNISTINVKPSKTKLNIKKSNLQYDLKSYNLQGNKFDSNLYKKEDKNFTNYQNTRSDLEVFVDASISKFLFSIYEFPFSDYVLDVTGDGYHICVETKGNSKYFFEGLNLIKIQDFKSNEFIIEKDGSITCIKENNIDIFSNDNASVSLYGATQTSFKHNTVELLDRKDIKRILNQYYPNISLEDETSLFQKISHCGCGYTAVANCIFNRYIGKEKEYKEKFGFDMYRLNNSGQVVYNYEPLILEIVLGYYDSSMETKCSIEDFYTNILKGTDQNTYNGIMEFLNTKYDMNLKYKCYNADYTYLTKDYLQKYLDDGWSFIIGTSGYDLYDYRTGELYIEDGGNHAMTLTGFTNEGKPIVSSWGKKYILDISNIDIENGDLFRVLNFK